jgi:hypothetical protein
VAQVPSQNPQIFALGVKEIWETDKPLDTVVHTRLAAPTMRSAAASYPLDPNLVALGWWWTDYGTATSMCTSCCSG